MPDQLTFRLETDLLPVLPDLRPMEPRLLPEAFRSGLLRSRRSGVLRSGSCGLLRSVPRLQPRLRRMAWLTSLG